MEEEASPGRTYNHEWPRTLYLASKASHTSLNVFGDEVVSWPTVLHCIQLTDSFDTGTQTSLDTPWQQLNHPSVGAWTCLLVHDRGLLVPVRGGSVICALIPAQQRRKALLHMPFQHILRLVPI
jgi:hypothetical protein